jgi:hypothetical protein
VRQDYAFDFSDIFVYSSRGKSDAGELPRFFLLLSIFKSTFFKYIIFEYPVLMY